MACSREVGYDPAVRCGVFWRRYGARVRFGLRDELRPQMLEVSLVTVTYRRGEPGLRHQAGQQRLEGLRVFGVQERDEQRALPIEQVLFEAVALSEQQASRGLRRKGASGGDRRQRLRRRNIFRAAPAGDEDGEAFLKPRRRRGMQRSMPMCCSI